MLLQANASGRFGAITSLQTSRLYMSYFVGQYSRSSLFVCIQVSGNKNRQLDSCAGPVCVLLFASCTAKSAKSRLALHSKTKRVTRSAVSLSSALTWASSAMISCGAIPCFHFCGHDSYLLLGVYVSRLCATHSIMKPNLTRLKYYKA